MKRRMTHSLLVLVLVLNSACSDDTTAGSDGPIIDAKTGDGPTADGVGDRGLDGPVADQPTGDHMIADIGPAADAAGTATIGAAGGSVASPDNHFLLLVPPGALAQDKVFTISATSSIPSSVIEVPSTVDTFGTVSAWTSHTSTWCLYHKGTKLIACCYSVTDALFTIQAKLKAASTTCAAVASVPASELTLAYVAPAP